MITYKNKKKERNNPMHYSTKTQNKSFINMWRFLQRNKIQNNIFMLQTNRKELVDFSIEKYRSMDRDDPYFNTYRSMIIDEAKENIWFYFRELVVIPDENSINGYKHFELDDKSMLMIYLFEKNKSFINLSDTNNLCLYLLWNRFKSLHNTDIVLINDHAEIERISDTVKKCISSMECKLPIGSTLAISDNTNRFIKCSIDAFKNHYFLQSNYELLDDIKYVYANNSQQNHWVKDDMYIFILEKDMPIITYSCIMNYLKSNKMKVYLNGIHDENSINTKILNNFLTANYNKATSIIYDIDENTLNDLYLV
jgi:hypothetical protein